ncbi:MAG: hypothetical protein FWG39_03095 [Alphaproteobacteria bacterium]|nr:hypothetical protein [Alphaproteobacteria bacterium]
MSNITKRIANGKTKEVYETTDPNTVAFLQKKTSVTADGTTTVDADGIHADMLVGYLLAQNDHIFSFLNALGIPTTFKCLENNYLFHEACEPLSLEFVYRGSLCNGSSIIARQPEKYGAPIGWSGENYSTDTAHTRFFGADGVVIPLDTPVLETFHKRSLVQSENGGVQMIPESQAVTNPRYFENGKMTEFMHADPILIAPKGMSDIWMVFDQKSVLEPQNCLSIIGRSDKMLYSPDDNHQQMADTDTVSRADETALQQQTLDIMRAIDMACKNTMFKKAGFADDGRIVFGEDLGYATIIDGKCEFGRMADGTYKLTDDMVSDNMRMAFNGKPSVSLKRTFQNYNSFEQKLMIAATFAEGTSIWKNQGFIRNIKEKLGR